MGQTAYSIAVQQMGELINKANLSEAAVKEALKPINEQLADMAYLTDPNRNILTVAKVGGQFNTINDAINYAKTYCTRTNRVTIQVGPGEYNEEIILLDNPGIDIIGTGKITTVKFPSMYPNSPIYTTGTGYFQNLNFVEDVAGNGYAFHYDSDNHPAGVVTFENCSFLSHSLAGVGIGLGQDTGCKFIGCEMSSTVDVPLYAHNKPASNVNNQILELRDCKLITVGGKNCINFDDSAKMYGVGNSKMTIIITNCLSNNPKISYRNGGTTMTYIPKENTDLTLSPFSVNNNILGVNYNDAETAIGGYIPVTDTGHFAIPIPFARERNYSIISAFRTTVDGGHITDTVSVGGAGENYITFSTTDEYIWGKGININVKATAK